MRKSRWFICVAIAAFAGCAGPVLAQESGLSTFGLHLGSWHAKDGYNNFNPGVYVEHNGWTAGTYYNSERKQTFYAGYTFRGAIAGDFGYGLSVGVATGYKRAPVVPMVVPSVSYSVTPSWGVRLSGVPPIGTIPGVLHLSVETRF